MKKIVLVLGLVMGSMLASDAFASNISVSGTSIVKHEEPKKETKKKRKSKKSCCSSKSEAASASKGHCSKGKSSCCSKKTTETAPNETTPGK